jgi:hypothetical protein
MVDPSYEIGKTYVDKAKPTHEDDQFMRWINLPGLPGIMNSPGIRGLNYKTKKSLPAVLILLTRTASSSYYNPWEDVIDLVNGRIYYWGDAKYDPHRSCEDFAGNKVLKKIFDEILTGNLAKVPPILHFSKPVPGQVIFNGVCVLKDLKLTWFEDDGRPVRNYRASLQILDISPVETAWLHRRVVGDLTDEPAVWKDYQKGRRPATFKIWRKKILSREDQLPKENSEDYELLKEVQGLTPDEFEKITVDLIQRIPEIVHSITKTRPTRDKGFDFFGEMNLPYPLNYKIYIRGEAKKYDTTTAVGPKDLSRLAAKLSRGEYGLFMTTSYFSLQAQEELYEDSYPMKLISGRDIVNFLKEFRLASNGRLNPEWLMKIKGK